VPRIGRYEIVSVLGRGSQATVYEVQAPDGARFALKALHEADLELMERLRREAQILQRLAGQARFVRCHEVGEERGRPYFVMDLVPGGTLFDALRAGRLGVGAALGVVGVGRVRSTWRTKRGSSTAT
jgi:serine/threonine protein kinase